MHVYHNTSLRRTPVFRDYFLFGLGAQGLRSTERDVFNNIFVQTEKVPGVAFVGMKGAEDLREGGNLIWGVRDGPALAVDPFASFRASRLFKDSQARYAPGWTTHDTFADPKFERLPADEAEGADLRLRPGSPAVNGGRTLPAEWPDPLREKDEAEPDAGAIPLGVAAWGVGVDGRVPLFGGGDGRAPAAR
jgi:hypothetical protein